MSEESDKPAQSLEERHFRLEQQRLQLEQDKQRFDRRFWHRNFGTMTTFGVAVLGLALSAAQVYVARTQRDIDAAQRAHEIELAQLQRDRELLAQEQRDLRTFLMNNQEKLFSSNTTDRDHMKQLLVTSFTPQVSKPAIDRLLSESTDPAQRARWTEAQTQVAKIATEQARVSVYLHYQDKQDNAIAAAIGDTLTGSGYNVLGREVVVQPTNGDVRYFHPEEQSDAQKIARIVQDGLKSTGREQEIKPIFAGRTFPNVPKGLVEVWIPKRS
jgi:hypothetical protein